MMKTLFTAGCLGTSLLAFGQGARPLLGKDTAVPSARFPATWYPKEFGMQATAPIAGAPYNAIMTMTTMVLDSQGKSTETSSQRTLKWRDSAGRFRDEELPPEIPGHHESFVGFPHQITAVDTVQHCQLTWSTPVSRKQKGEAAVYCASRQVSRQEDNLATRMRDPKPEIVQEQLGPTARTTTTTPLGKRVIQGLEVVGIRSVTTDLDANGKLQDTKEVEIWWSPALHESLLMTVRTHDYVVTWEMTEIKMDEPDKALFYPPLGYSIRKEAEMQPLSVPPGP